MKLIALFVICLVVKINTESKRLLLIAGTGKCPPVNLCSGFPCLECNPKNGQCIDLCCLDDTDCKGQKVCLNGFCSANDCPDPCVDPDNNFEPFCPVGETCKTLPTTDPVSGSILCPVFVKCHDTTGPNPCTICGEGFFCCDELCFLCADDEICSSQSQLCEPYP
eukprot:UN00198